MDRYYTVMVVPEREKGVRSLRIPRVLFHAGVFFVLISVVLLGILSYDYWKILRQVHENKHLSLENQQLKEQIQLFQMKINSLSEDLERIKTFEKKLRIITGFQEFDKTQPLKENQESGTTTPGDIKLDKDADDQSMYTPTQLFEMNYSNLKFQLDNYESEPKYNELKDLYEQKIATSFGLTTGYTFTKEWSDLTKQSFKLASGFAEFDFKFKNIKQMISGLEVDIHKLDQYLLDRNSFLRSTPTLIPTRGWITSYYGLRKSPYSGRIKMHEGIDVGANYGTQIVAPADGIVTFAGKKPGFGHIVQVDHGYGIETIFAHNSKNTVKKGMNIARGQIIAQVGNSGLSTGPHLHYEIRVNGTPVDPLYYILD